MYLSMYRVRECVCMRMCGRGRVREGLEDEDGTFSATLTVETSALQSRCQSTLLMDKVGSRVQEGVDRGDARQEGEEPKR
jgi:hypothetical protein